MSHIPTSVPGGHPDKREPPPAYHPIGFIEQPPHTTMPQPQPVTYAPLPGGQVVAPNTVIVMDRAPTIVISNPELQCRPVKTTCYTCRHTVTTRVIHAPSTKTHLWAFLMFLLGCWICCFLPYCIHSCKNAHHYCPNCGTYLGTALH